MTITKRNNRWYDENNNSWITEESATQYSPTLTNCYDCRGCSNCSSCYSCSYCGNCKDCFHCYLCKICSNLRFYEKGSQLNTIIRVEANAFDRKLEIDL